MKLSVLFAAMISGYLCGNTVNVRIDGKFTCSHAEFNYRVKLWEEDNSNHDFIAEEKAEGAWEEDYYSMGGPASDLSWFESYVEPFMTIEYSCGIKHECVCKFFKPTNVDLTATVNIDLKHHTFKRCDACAQAEALTQQQKADNDGW